MEKENIDSSRDSYLIKFLISVFNIMGVIRNAFYKSLIFHTVKKFKPT